MAVRNHNWFNAQASRRYPLDDNSTGTGDDGTRLKDDILVDLHLRWPRIAGEFAFLGGITVTDNIVTLVILAADSLTTASTFTPLASVTVPQPANRHQYYNLEALYPGVGGFVAFGDTHEVFNLRFSTPQQGLLAPKVARPYDKLPIPTMRKLGRSDGLTGLVKILAGPDVEIIKRTDEVAGIDTDVMVIRLVNPTSERSVLSDYIGPCGVRPESRNCVREGVETLNGVGPDCDGNLEIVFEGLVPGPYASCGSDGAGVTLDQSLGIEDVCVAGTPDRFQGTDSCAPSESLSSSVSLPSESAGPTPSSSEGSSEGSSRAVECEDLPFLECFDALSLHDSWDVKIGSFDLTTAYETPSEPEGCRQSQTCAKHWSGFSSFSSLSSSFSANSVSERPTSFSSGSSCWSEWSSLSSLSSLFSSLSSTSSGSSAGSAILQHYDTIPIKYTEPLGLDCDPLFGYSSEAVYEQVHTGTSVIQWAVPWESTSSSSCALGEPGALRLTDPSRRNVITWDDCGYAGESLGKKITTHVRLTNQGARINGGIALNYHLVDPFTAPRFEYFIAQINRSDNKVELLRHNGALFIVENSVAPSTPFSLNDWYSIEATATDAGGGNVLIAVAVRNVTDPSWPSVNFSVVTSRWGNNDGYHGLATNRSIAIFGHWSIEDA